MLIRVGETTVPDPEGNPVTFKVLQALDPMFNLPIAQVAVPKGEHSVRIGDAMADRGEAGEPKLIVPDFIPPEELRPDDPK